MCILLHYRCPLCRRFTSTKERSLCAEGRRSRPTPKRCYSPVWINRWVGRKQFLEGWYCGNRACDYSRISQTVFEADCETTIEGQTKKYQSVYKVLDPTDAVDFSTLGSAADLQAFEASDPKNGKRKRETEDADLPTIVMNKPIPIKDGDFESDQTAGTGARKRQRLSDDTEATKSQTETEATAAEGDEPVIRRPHRKEWVDLKTLDPDNERLIRTLRAKVNKLNPYRPGESSTWWASAENHLLAVCTDLRIPVRQTVSYLPRRSLNECRARLDTLRDFDKDIRLETRAMKAKVDDEK